MAMNLSTIDSNERWIQMNTQMLYHQRNMLMNHYMTPEELNITWPMAALPENGPKLPGNVKLELANKALWDQFHAESTEMIITKSGRRMFPLVQLNASGLDPKASYTVLLEFLPATNRRHKYIGGAGDVAKGWTSAGPSEPQPPLERRVFRHPDSPASGAHWMQQPISFLKVKLTNNAIDNSENILLTSMHKYIPRVWLIRLNNTNNPNDLYLNPSANFVFPETEFVAVTAYQNDNITKLKIDHNPFAKGFRETGQSCCKRKRRLQNDTSVSTSDGEEEGSDDSDSTSTSKRARLSEDDDESTSSVSTSEREVATPPEERRENTQPRVYRPWCDGKTVSTVSSTNYEHCIQPNYMDLRTTHYQYTPLDLARFYHMQSYFYVAQRALR